MWIDKRHHWHVIYEGGCACTGGHAYSLDGLTWSNISGAYNNSRPVLNPNGTVTNVSTYIGRPKLLLGADGFTPIAIYGGTDSINGVAIHDCPVGDCSMTVVSPLAGGN